MKRLIYILILFPLTIVADLDFEPTVSSYMVRPISDEQMNAIAETFEIVRQHDQDRGFEVYVPSHLSEVFHRLAPEAELLSADIREELLNTFAEEPEAFSQYHSLDEVEATLKKIAAEHPEIAQLETYGRSKKGRTLYALKLSDNVRVDENEKELLITSATHGDEIITVEVVLSLLEDLVNGYEKDPRLTNMIKDRELFFIPVVNPDGFARRSRYTGGVDPNRAYPLITGGQKYSAVCIEHLIRFTQKREFLSSLDIHASGQLVIFPWAYTRERTHDDQEFSHLAADMASQNGYRHGQISRILYPAPGSSADYYYWKNKTLALAIEVGRSKAPRGHQINQVIENAREMVWKFIEN